MNDKTCNEMNFQEFNDWAIQYVVGQFLDGGLRGIRSAVGMVISQAALNEVFGGNRKVEKK